MPNPGAAPLRVGLLTPWSSRLGGGVFEAVVAQADAIRRMPGLEPVVFASRDEFTDQDAQRWGDTRVVTGAVGGPKFFGYVPNLLRDVVSEKVDILHLHGIWLYPSMLGAAWAARTGRPYLISPHGMLAPWILARGRWKKALARHVYENRSWRRASAFHALTEAEIGDILSSVPGARTVRIPNAVPPAPRRAGERPGNRVAYLGRIHPKKNIPALLKAWAVLRGRGAIPDGTTLSIAGWGEPGDVADLRRLLAEMADPAVEFVGPVYGDAKAGFLASARCLVLPSFSEGLPVVVLEAWAAGVPALITDDCNLPEGFEAGAALRIGHDPEDIARVLGGMLTLDADGWRTMSDAARHLAADTFGPQRIDRAWLETYRSLAGA